MRHRTQHRARLHALALALPRAPGPGRDTPDTTGPAPSSRTSIPSPAGLRGPSGGPRM
ncbi:MULTISPECIES: hypothetical protein [Streptomyces]|uniref:hypothetical protein n=1 Tax=Streptomyces TaxID=1883 RepID=UPI001E2D8950|nr:MULTISPECIES: hypothetical protein [Streptomyces]UFQ15038.1 hypothetical protein J2N69_08480 [Streptomyces huasconensis]WCL84644.1 hypothetical protein PPN52_08495 [Streptomyces sp. JCM 35825]